MYFNVDNMIAQGYSKVAKVKIPGIFYINTMNDSTVAFDFTRNHLQVREDSLTAVTPFEASVHACRRGGQRQSSDGAEAALEDGAHRNRSIAQKRSHETTQITTLKQPTCLDPLRGDGKKPRARALPLSGLLAPHTRNAVDR